MIESAGAEPLLLLKAVPHAAETLTMTQEQEVVLCARNTTQGTPMLGKHTPQTITRSTIRMALPNLSNLAMAIAELSMVERVQSLIAL